MIRARIRVTGSWRTVCTQEFEGHHNRRPMDTADQMGRMARAADGKRLRYRDLVA